MKKITIIDPTLRDGNHAVSQSISLVQIEAYVRAVDKAGVPFIEVGHGLGLGASSLQSGICTVSDRDIVRTAKSAVTNSKIQCFVLPGTATINKDIQPAIEMGADAFRIGVHCTEGNLAKKHVDYLKEKGITVFVSLMMMHLASKEVLYQQCREIQRYGADGIVLMDSAGSSFPAEIEEKIGYLISRLDIPIGYHGHDNLGLSVANSIAAVEVGATIIDGTAAGFGAGAGNTQLELIVAILHRLGYETGVDLYALFDAAAIVKEHLLKELPNRSPFNIVSGVSGVCGAFTKHIQRISDEYQVDARDVCLELGRRKAVAGQEDLIVEVASHLSKGRTSVRE
jgi:4-hydroxy 2-oxovalerate aldolase